jgi:hypothetical protein
MATFGQGRAKTSPPCIWMDTGILDTRLLSRSVCLPMLRQMSIAANLIVSSNRKFTISANPAA